MAPLVASMSGILEYGDNTPTNDHSETDGTPSYHLNEYDKPCSQSLDSQVPGDAEYLKIIYSLRTAQPEDIVTKLVTVLEERRFTSSQLESLEKLLEIAGIMRSGAEVAVRDKKLRHCVRCHREFLEVENVFNSCRAHHDEPVLSLGSSHVVKFACCGDSEYLVNGQPPPLHKTRHTTRVIQIRDCQRLFKKNLWRPCIIDQYGVCCETKLSTEYLDDHNKLLWIGQFLGDGPIIRPWGIGEP